MSWPTQCHARSSCDLFFFHGGLTGFLEKMGYVERDPRSASMKRGDCRRASKDQLMSTDIDFDIKESKALPCRRVVCVDHLPLDVSQSR